MVRLGLVWLARLIINFYKGGVILVYQWKSGSQVKAKAQIAGEVCEHLEHTVGLTAKTLLDASRPENAPLHNCFEWDDAVAAESYREQQASYIIRSLETVVEGTQPERVRAYFRVSGDNRYENTKTIISDAEKRNSLLEMAFRELSWFRRKYETLSELATIFDAMERLGV